MKRREKRSLRYDLCGIAAVVLVWLSVYLYIKKDQEIEDIKRIKATVVALDFYDGGWKQPVVYKVSYKSLDNSVLFSIIVDGSTYYTSNIGDVVEINVK